MVFGLCVVAQECARREIHPVRGSRVVQQYVLIKYTNIFEQVLIFFVAYLMMRLTIVKGFCLFCSCRPKLVFVESFIVKMN